MRTLHVLMGFLVLAGFPNPASSATITVDAEKDLVPVNSLLSGTNLHAKGESGEPIKALIRDGADRSTCGSCASEVADLKELIATAAVGGQGPLVFPA